MFVLNIHTHTHTHTIPPASSQPHSLALLLPYSALFLVCADSEAQKKAAEQAIKEERRRFSERKINAHMPKTDNR